MNESQADDMVDLLEKILNRLDEIDSKINSKYDLSDIYSKLNDLDRTLDGIESNTT